MAKAKKIAEDRRLNPEQQAVADHVRGPLRVGAVAGSGKTHALIERAVSLVEQQRVPPSKVLLISFSVNARKEMEKRLAERLPAAAVGEICRTFHSIGLDIFRAEVDHSKSWEIDTTGRLWRNSIRLAAKKMGFDLASKGSGLNLKMIEQFASLAKTQVALLPRTMRKLGMPNAALKTLADRASETYADDLVDILHEAEDVREVVGIEENGMYLNFVTFDDMLNSAALLLREKVIRERWATRWQYIMQDEAQDSNPVQDEIAEALGSVHRNYMIVGDPAQAIFGFRGSRPERMLRFTDVWPGAQTVVMNRNYRSGVEVVSLANRVIAKMPPDTVIATSMVCERQTRAYVACHTFDDERAEARAIATNIKAHFDQGVAWKDQAIIIRANSMASVIEVALATATIPYRIVSGDSFFQMSEASILFGYLRTALDRATADDVETSIANPSRMVGKAYFEQLRKLREAHPNKTWSELALMPSLGRRQAENMEEWQGQILTLKEGLAAGLTAYQLLTKLVKDVKLVEWLKSDADGDNTPIDNVEQVLAFAAEYDTAAAMLDSVDKILAHKKASARARNTVEVSTIHRYKGREASVIYMPNLVTGMFPSSRADLNEERRLFYVGVTRAMDELWMSYPRFRFDDAETTPSTFLDEANVPVDSTFAPGRKVQPQKIGTQMGFLL